MLNGVSFNYEFSDSRKSGAMVDGLLTMVRCEPQELAWEVWACLPLDPEGQVLAFPLPSRLNQQSQQLSPSHLKKKVVANIEEIRNKYKNTFILFDFAFDGKTPVQCANISASMNSCEDITSSSSPT